MSKPKTKRLAMPRWRFLLLLLTMLALPALSLWHIAGLQVLPNADRGFEFLQGQGDARTVRTETIPAYRGLITDRNGEPLAVSTPVVSIWVNPRDLDLSGDNAVRLSRALDLDPGHLRERVDRYRSKEFMYLARHLTPVEARAVLDLDIPGVFGQREYKRFYPAGEVTAQLVGFTNIDDSGQEGVELAFNDWLTGVPGAKRVVKDRKGRIIKDVGLIRSEKSGSDLALSIDLRLQYLAYRELKAAINRYRAASGSLVMLDARTGEVLAMVNQPSFNPNDRTRLDTPAMRNRAVTDLVEPGSTMKPFSMVAALESGKFRPETRIDTSPGYLWINPKTITDPRNYGVLDLGGILAKSSQVGMTKVAMQLPPENIRDVFERVGLGQSPGTGFPGESPGALPQHRRWHPIEQATLAYGYGLSVTPLQLAQAYSVLANQGERRPVSLLRVDKAPPAERVIDRDVAGSVREMLIGVTARTGTGSRAAIPAYTVAGKTGTARKVGLTGYEEDRHVAIFAGMVPAHDPRLVTVVVVNDPRTEDKHGGGLMAAPVFSRATGDALRLLRVAPDRMPDRKVVEVAVALNGDDAT